MGQGGWGRDVGTALLRGGLTLSVSVKESWANPVPRLERRAGRAGTMTARAMRAQGGAGKSFCASSPAGARGQRTVFTAWVARHTHLVKS